MANYSRRLELQKRALILEALMAGKSAARVGRELHHDLRTVRKVAREHGIKLLPRSRKIRVPPEIERGAAHLLAHSHVTIGEIAASFGLRRNTLKRRLHEAGVRGYGRHLRPSERARIEELLGQQLSPLDVSRRVGRHVRTVERIRARMLLALGEAAAARASLPAPDVRAS